MNRRSTGFIFTELIVSITLLGTMTVCLALALNSFRRFNHIQWMRQRCMAVAQAQLDTINATGKPLSEEVTQRLWPHITTDIQFEAGQDQWSGLQRVEVKAQGKSFRKTVTISLARYMEAQ